MQEEEEDADLIHGSPMIGGTFGSRGCWGPRPPGLAWLVRPGEWLSYSHSRFQRLVVYLRGSNLQHEEPSAPCLPGELSLILISSVNTSPSTPSIFEHFLFPCMASKTLCTSLTLTMLHAVCMSFPLVCKL